MQSTEEIIKEHSNKIEVSTLKWVLSLIRKFPIENAIAEIERYKRELEDE